MKIAIVQFDNRPPQELGAMPTLIQRNRAYAARQGYDYHFVDQIHFDLPVYWQKLGLCRRALEAGYDAVVWLDTDAVMHDLDRRIEELFEGPEIMVAAGDNPFWSSPFNAGVFVVKAADGAGVRLLDRWAGLFAGTAWTRTQTAWICEDEWAGPAFEQGAFTARLLPELSGSRVLRLVDWRTLQSPFPVPGAFTLHFPGPFKVNIPAYLGSL